MPEGHTIHRIARDHSQTFVGDTLRVSSPQGRFSAGAKRLDGCELESVEAYGKHLCYRWTGGKLLHIHLGLYGRFETHGARPPEPQGQVRLRVVGDKRAFDLRGPNTCEVITGRKWMEITKRLGADPLRKDADPDQAWERISRSRTAIGARLLDQSVICGVGNVYRSEVLHLLGIHPRRMCNCLSRAEFDRLWGTLVSLLKIGVRYNRIIVADPAEVGKPRSKMNQDERLLIYKREVCSRCDSVVEISILGARKVFACPRCQRV